MTSIGFYEARTHLSQLLDRVSWGAKILITRRGKSVAMLMPPPSETKKDVRQVVREMLEFRDREGPTLGDEATLRELIEEGRRF